jgi:hypothetical protein
MPIAAPRMAPDEVCVALPFEAAATQLPVADGALQLLALHICKLETWGLALMVANFPFCSNL